MTADSIIGTKLYILEEIFKSDIFKFLGRQMGVLGVLIGGLNDYNTVLNTTAEDSAKRSAALTVICMATAASLFAVFLALPAVYAGAGLIISTALFVTVNIVITYFLNFIKLLLLEAILVASLMYRNRSYARRGGALEKVLRI